MIYPSYEAVAKTATATGCRRHPIKMEIGYDMLTPVMAVKKLRAVSNHVFILESAHKDKRWGRYSFIGFDPVMEITCVDGHMKIRSSEGTAAKAAKDSEGINVRPEDPAGVGTLREFDTDKPGEVIREIIRENRAPKLPDFPPFAGGLVGYFSYDYIRYSEPGLKLSAEDEEDFKDLDLMLFDKVIAFDNYMNRIILMVNVRCDDLLSDYSEGMKKLMDMRDLLLNGEMWQNPPLRLKSDFKPMLSEEEYCEIVEKGKHHIHEGDIFQIVLSNRIEADTEGSLFDTYRVLRRTNPSPYMFYFSSDDIELAGASPETLVRLEGDKLNTFPLAGTRPRGATEEEDLKLEKELLADEKERAEHNMLVDLGRNDIGKISKIGTVEVEKYMEIERFSHVMHIGSTVGGIIRDDRDALDAIDSILPAGTLSGAPKLRACELICELEKNKRGIYGGAIGYIDLTGNLDTCIAIRLAFSKNGKVFVRSGAGIVADSVPKTEFKECMNKARAVLNALKEAEGGLDR